MQKILTNGKKRGIIITQTKGDLNFMKVMKKLSLLLVICLAFSIMLTGCSSPAGTYKFQSLTTGTEGIQMELTVGEKYLGYLTLTEDFVVITLEKDGTAIMKVSLGDDQTGTWEKTGKNEITLTIDGESDIMILDGDLLILQDDIGKLTLKKSK